MAILSYGPYYESKIQSKEKTKKALTGQGYTPEELAGATYGELMARYKDAEVRRQQETDTALRQQQLGLQGRQIRGQEKAAKSAERGPTVSGIATGVNVLDKVGALKWGGGVLKSGGKALTGLISPQVAAAGGGGGMDYSGYGGGAEDIWSGADYGDYAVGDMGDYSWASSDFGEYDLGGTEDIFSGVDLDCFITTAAVRHIGLEDGGQELNKLRWFRDNILSKMVGGMEDIVEYYRIAPDIVKRLNAFQNADKIYKRLWGLFIIPAIKAIDRKQYKLARVIYQTMVQRLKGGV